MSHPINQQNLLAVFQAMERGVQDGLPLRSTLLAFAEAAETPHAARAFQAIVSELDRGKPLSQAVQSQRWPIPTGSLQLIERGAAIGRLDLALQCLIAQRAIREDLGLRVRLATTYQLIVCLCSIALILFMLIQIVPQFEKIFGDFGVEIPVITQLLVSASNIARSATTWKIVGGIGCLALGVTCLTNLTSEWRSNVRRLWEWIPLVRRLHDIERSSEFCELLAVPIGAAIPFPDALRFAACGMEQSRLGIAAFKLAQRLEQGHDLIRSSEQVRMPRAIALAMSGTADAIPDELRAIGDLYAARFQQSLWGPEVLLNFAMVAITGLVVLGGIVGVFAPLIQLLNQLS